MLLQRWCADVAVLLECAVLLVALAAAPQARARIIDGDLNGDGSVDATDEQIMGACFGGAVGEPYFDPAADFTADGRVDVSDLALLGANFGTSGGDPDTTPPGLFLSLNDIPDDMNDLLVVPPERFQITLAFDAGGHSVIDRSSLVVTSSEDVGPYPAGTDLGPFFTVTPTRAVWEVPAGSDLARTSHYLTASIRDAASNEASASYGFAVRDFAYGPPLGNLQTIFLDFDQDRSLGPEVDFIEDLRAYGLSSPAAPQLEAQVRDLMVSEIVKRVQAFYVRDVAGGVDAVNIVFVAQAPATPHARFCVGGESSQAPYYLGAATLDVNNLGETPNECVQGAQFGVFPEALDNLWGSDPDLIDAFSAVDPSLGGTPFGEHPVDSAIAAPDFNFFAASSAEINRFFAVIDAADAFAQAIASAIAHEVGHTLGLSAPGPAPAGLWGGTSGPASDHNVAVGGGIPAANHLMNPGGSFSFGELTGRGGSPLPAFRPLSWAYLRDRIALNTQVTALYPRPALGSVEPAVVSFPQGSQAVTVTFHGSGFVAPPTIELETAGDPTPNQVLEPTVVDPETATGIINKFFVQAAVYDVRFVNGDGQTTVLSGGLVVQ